MKKVSAITNRGTVTGEAFVIKDKTNKTYFAFQKIPYAEVPEGPLRFSDPETIESFRYDPDRCKKFEDFLYLHVYCTQFRNSDTNTFKINEEVDKPVMVFVPGDLPLGNYTTEEFYGPDYLMCENVVLVIISYRRGIFGFLKFQEKAARAPGDVGLKDIALAFTWVREEITNFGGNPANVTAFGQGLGAAYIRLLLGSPFYDNLFSKAILQSSLSCLIPNRGTYNGNEIAKSLGVNRYTDDVICANFLRSLSAKTLLSYNVETFGQRCCRVVRKEKLIALEEEVNYSVKIPIMLGYNSFEGIIEHIIHDGFEEYDIDDLEMFFVSHINKDLREDSLQEACEKLRLYFYKHGVKSKEPLLEIISDTHYNIGVIATAAHFAKAMGPQNIYLYRFEIDDDLNAMKNLHKVRPGSFGGASHGDELGYIFKTPPLQNIKKQSTSKQQMASYWTQFAKTGNPNPIKSDAGQAWKPMKSLKPTNWLKISEDSLVYGEIPEAHRMKFWETIYNYKFYNVPEKSLRHERTNIDVEEQRRENASCEFESSNQTSSETFSKTSGSSSSSTKNKSDSGGSANQIC